MGQNTRLQILTEGGLLGQRDNIAAQTAPWLQRWLDSVAASWAWPMLKTEAVGIACSTASVVLGGGSGGISTKILKILDNIWLYDSNRTIQQRLRIRTQLTQPRDRISPTTYKGLPTQCRVFETSFGVWTLYFDPAPDRAYLMTLPYLQLPAALAADTDIPWYPNDETMVQAVAFKVHEFYDGKSDPLTIAAQQGLAQRVAEDRLRYGQVNGVNDLLQLNPARFTRSQVP